MDSSLSFQILSILIILTIGGWAFYFFYFKKQEKSAAQNMPYLSALKFMAENNNRRAVEKFKEAVREDSDNIDAYLKLGDILRKEGMLKNAARIHRDLSLRSNLKEDDKNKIWFSMGLDYWQLKNLEAAETYFKKLLDQKKYKLQVAPYLVKIYETVDRYKEAANVIENAGLIKDEKYQTKLILLKVLEAGLEQEKDEGKAARILYKEALKKKPDCVAAVFFIGESYIKEKRVEEALNIWSEFCYKYPQKAKALFPSLEKTYFEQGNFNKIQELYETILKTDPTNVAACKALSAILRKKGDYDTALTLISDCQNGNEEMLNSEIITILFEKGRYKEAAAKAISSAENADSGPVKIVKCTSCGFTSSELFVKCPQCGTIDEHI